MFHVIYKTINLVNNKYYIGYHKTEDLNDTYLGSGVFLKKAINKYGKENFKKEILFIFNNKESALLKEHELVNQDIINDKKSYNLKIGGEGGWDYINNKLKYDPVFRNEVYKKSRKRLKEAYENGSLNHMKKALIKRNKKFLWAKDNELSEETKKKISENNGNKLSEEEIKNIKDKIINSDIDFAIYGWVKKVALLINRKPQKVNYIMKKYLSDFYEEKCFKRK